MKKLELSKGKGQIERNGKPRTETVRGVLYLCAICFALLFGGISAWGINAEKKTEKEPDTQSTSLTVSLITCWPGSEIYELCGHEAIRIHGEDFDSVWNFGLFDFSEPNFVYRFVKGETDYKVAGYPFAYFLPEYINDRRKVEEQVLNLTPAQAEKIRKLLQVKSLPQNCRYRYNYIRNNCSTQIADILDSVTGGTIVYQDSMRFGSFREAMNHYHRNYPWYQFGIDLALGSELDRPLTKREEFFTPIDFNRHAGKALLADGTPLVRTTIILNEGSEDAVLPPTPWFLGPLFWSIVVALISIGTVIYGIQKRTTVKWWYSVYFGIAGLAGCLVTFLVFISSHAATSPNMLILWLNPLQLIIPIFIWNQRMKAAVKAMMWINVCVAVIMLVFWPIYCGGQSHVASFLILIASDLVLAAGYLRNKDSKESKGRKGVNGRKGAKGNKGNKGTKRGRASKKK